MQTLFLILFALAAWVVLAVPLGVVVGFVLGNRFAPVAALHPPARQ